VRIVGFESSSRRGSIALLERGCLIASLSHEEPERHAERLLPLLERLLAEAGWPKSSIDRLGVGVGPGSFTGLRAGIALAEGLSVGLDRPLVGVGSLRAMAYGALREHMGPCCALLDARRGELFAGVYAANGQELMAPAVLPSPELPGFLSKNAVRTLVGEAAAPLSEGRVWASGATLDLPHARWVAALAAELDEGDFPPEPEYVRGIGATLPSLPRPPIDPQ
jgi:tRNA threonylcarbamoyladenosine biosynthesis protein TsaB